MSQEQIDGGKMLIPERKDWDYLHVHVKIVNSPGFDPNDRPSCPQCGSFRVYGEPSYQCPDCGWLDPLRYEVNLQIKHEKYNGSGSDWLQTKRARGVGDWR